MMMMMMMMYAQQTGHPAQPYLIRAQRKLHRTVHVGTAPVRSQHVVPRGTLGSSEQSSEADV